MKKLLPLFLLLAILILPQPAYAGLSEGCFPIVECDPGEDYYGGSCQAHIETLANCPNPGAPTKYPAFTCSAGCYEKTVSVPSPPPTCPGGIDFSGNCLIKLDVLDDDADVDSVGNPAFKIWDGANLTEMVHLDTAGCTDDQTLASDSSELTGWKCEDKVLTGCADDQVAIADSGAPTGWSCEDQPSFLTGCADGEISVSDSGSPIGWSCAVGPVVGAVCADDQVAIANSGAPTGWSCADQPSFLSGCADDQLAVADVASPKGWKCENKPAASVSLKDYVDGVVDFLDTLMTELGVDNTVKTDIVNALKALGDGSTPAELATLATKLLAFSIPSVVNNGYSGLYAGKTAGTYNGSQSGYEAVNAYCDAFLTDSHVCTAAEIINTYNYDPTALAALSGPMWINSGPPAYTTAAPNDCNGWTNNTSSFFATSWNFDIDFGTASSCNLTQSFACCK